MISVILIEPEWPSNIGAVARAMANFDLKDLILINPKCDKNELDAVKRAKHALPILKKSKIKTSDSLKKFDYLIGTTAILGTERNLPRNAVTPKEVSKKINQLSSNVKVGLLIGRDGSGLNNKEVNMCDILVTIPASKKYPTLNISHAASIIFYEIFKKTKETKSNSHIKYATKKELDVIQEYLMKALNKLNFSTKEKKETQVKAWKKIFGKALLTKKEAFAVMGFFRKLLKN